MSNIIMQKINTGPIQEMRNTFCPRALLDKEVMKLQDENKRLKDDIREFVLTNVNLQDQFDCFKESHVS